MLPELENLRARLGDAKGALDKEHLKSADLENKCQQLEEELKFKMSLLEKELVEVRSHFIRSLFCENNISFLYYKMMKYKRMMKLKQKKTYYLS